MFGSVLLFSLEFLQWVLNFPNYLQALHSCGLNLVAYESISGTGALALSIPAVGPPATWPLLQEFPDLNLYPYKVRFSRWTLLWLLLCLLVPRKLSHLLHCPCLGLSPSSFSYFAVFGILFALPSVCMWIALGDIWIARVLEISSTKSF